MKRYYITDRRRCPADLLDCVEANARAGVERIQLREKDLPVRDLLALARAALRRIRGRRAKLLVNGRLDVALAAGAHGVHLPADAPPVPDLRAVAPRGFLIAASTHDVGEVLRAEREGADFVVFGPVFPTESKPGTTCIPGLDGLRSACRLADIPVYALGGVRADRAGACLDAGAAAIAGIGMFQSPEAITKGSVAARLTRP